MFIRERLRPMLSIVFPGPHVDIWLSLPCTHCVGARITQTLSALLNREPSMFGLRWPG